MAKRKVKRGGTRLGSGRKPAYPGEGPAVRVSFSCSERLAKRIDEAAGADGRSKLIVRLVDAGLRDAVAGGAK